MIYRNVAGVDMAAIVTGLVLEPDDEQQVAGVHLELFPPPGLGKDLLNTQWGVRQTPDPAEPEDGCWRWPERTS